MIKKHKPKKRTVNKNSMKTRQKIDTPVVLAHMSRETFLSNNHAPMFPAGTLVVFFDTEEEWKTAIDRLYQMPSKCPGYASAR